MPQRGSDFTAPDGSLGEAIIDVDTGDEIVRRLLPFDRQPVSIRRRDEARGAIADWELLERIHAALAAGGQAYWNTVAPDAGLPATAGAYSAALAFLVGRRDKAMSRAIEAVNRWRIA